MEKYYTPSEAMVILGIKRTKYYALLKENKLSFFITRDGQKRHTEEQLREYLAYKKVDADEE